MSTLDAVVLAYLCFCFVVAIGCGEWAAQNGRGEVRWFLGGLLLPLPTLAVLGFLNLTPTRANAPRSVERGA